jgi:ligand-binding sensor domain-containing protein
MNRILLTKLLYSVFLLALTGTNVTGQNTYRFGHLGVEDGLSQGSIYNMFKDSRGFMWLGTEDGINRFDGKNVQVYLSGSTGRSTNVLGIGEDSSANLWIGSHRGYYRYVRATNKFVRPALQGKLENVSVHVFVDTKKNIWFLSEIGLYRLTAKGPALVNKDFALNRNQYNNFLSETANGDLWLVDADSGLKRLSNSDKKVTYYFSDRPDNVFGEPQSISCIGIDRNGYLLLASRNGLLRFDYQKNTTFSYKLNFDLTRHGPTDVETDRRGMIWLATEGNGILIFDPKSNKQVSHLRHQDDIQNSLRFNEVSTIYIDKNDDIFVNTDPQGLDIITTLSSAFSFYTYGKQSEYDLNGYSARGVEEGTDSTIWIGTELGGVNRLWPKTGKIKHYTTSNGLAGNTIRFILNDSENRIWVASANGLSYFMPDEDRFKSVGLPVVCEISNLLFIGHGILLLSSNKGLMMLRTTDMQVTEYVYPGLLAGYGSYWDATNGIAYLANRYRGVNTFHFSNDRPVLDNHFLENFHVLQMYREPNTPFLWVCTDTGLVKWDMIKRKLLKNYRIADGLHHEYLYHLLPDKAGHFWLSTNRGITRFDPQTEHFELIKEIPPREYNSRSAVAARNGNLYFGSTTGLDLIKPALLTLQNIEVGVQLTDLIYDNQPAGGDSMYIGELASLHLPFASNTFTLKFAATDFRSGGMNRYRYFLKGYDKDTIYAGDVDQVRYARLPAGEYEFQLQASDLGGNWVSPVRKLAIVVFPPFWQTWWFILLTIVFLTVLVYFSVITYLNSRLTAQRLESERKIYLEKERTRIARDMNDSLGSELFGLKLLGQVALSQNRSEDSDTYLQKIVTVSKSISEKISEVIWLTDSNQDNAESLWSYIQKNALLYLKPSGIHYQFEDVRRSNGFLISGERRHEILTFHKQLFLELSNSLDTAGIEIRFKIIADHLLISISNADSLREGNELLACLTKLRGIHTSKQPSIDLINIPLRD